jgi:hypothetical protein
VHSALDEIVGFLNSDHGDDVGHVEYCMCSELMEQIAGISMCPVCDVNVAIYASDFIRPGLEVYRAASKRDDAKAEGAMVVVDRLKVAPHVDVFKRKPDNATHAVDELAPICVASRVNSPNPRMRVIHAEPSRGGSQINQSTRNDGRAKGSVPEVRKSKAKPDNVERKIGTQIAHKKSPVSGCSVPRSDGFPSKPGTGTEVPKRDGGLTSKVVDIGVDVLNKCALENYTRFFGLPEGCTTLAQVENSSNGVAGWANYDGPALHTFEVPAISNSEPRQAILDRRKQKKLDKKLQFLMSDSGQKQLEQMELDRCTRNREAIGANNLSIIGGSLSPLDYANPGGSQISPVSPSTEWIEIEMTADTGACDTVMPKSGPFEGIQIHPSQQSERGMLYEVANKQTIPCLGERRLEIWTEGASAPRNMAVQVADVHKPLLSLSRCADSGFQSMFGQTAGALVDIESHDVIPLKRRGNLYYLRAWIRAAPFGRPR